MISFRPLRRCRLIGMEIVSARWSDAQLLQLVEQPLGVHQIPGPEALGEPAGERGEQVPGFGALALLCPQPGEAARRAQFP
jgi:hypothetical protein